MSSEIRQIDLLTKIDQLKSELQEEEKDIDVQQEKCLKISEKRRSLCLSHDLLQSYYDNIRYLKSIAQVSSCDRKQTYPISSRRIQSLLHDCWVTKEDIDSISYSRDMKSFVSKYQNSLLHHHHDIVNSVKTTKSERKKTFDDLDMISQSEYERQSMAIEDMRVVALRCVRKQEIDAKIIAELDIKIEKEKHLYEEETQSHQRSKSLKTKEYKLKHDLSNIIRQIEQIKKELSSK
ncbi:hypothetical protein ADUPG1_013271 [Aduncisulcus paluster]|uniref:Uncharacterized protein n=1 Tax=Aduncisulcus paluster TaxID=2918883 RepID=A0ABQ5K460_9EUKA|nr:hypothetical protein ADUPG1_013271 [Aduncisulcus paluster]